MRSYGCAVRGRGRKLREQSVMFAFDMVRLRGDAEAGKAKSLGDYLDELLSADELLEKTSARLAAAFDAQIARHEAKLQ